jgi:predicted glycosyltransferase
MENKGNNVLFTVRDKEFEIDLLKANNFKYVSFGKKYKSTIGKLYGLCKFDVKEWQVCHMFKPDILLSHGSPYAAHAAWLTGKPHISFEDTYNREQIKLYEPFTDVVLTADYKHPFVSKREIYYTGYHELAYLHPNYYSPDKSILGLLGVSENEKYVMMRFVSWNASHDIGHKGISFNTKMQAIKEFSNYAKIFISSEGELPKELESYRLTTPPDRIFDVMQYATLIWGESRTMPAECSILGVPSIINHNTRSLYLKDQEDKYNLCYNYSESTEDQLLALQKCIEILKCDKDEIRKTWDGKRAQLLAEHIDVTAFMVWFIENYPESKRIMRENPDYQYRFK